MSGDSANDCRSEFKALGPAKPWTTSTPASDFEPLINRIDRQTQSDLFRRVGKYSANDDYYELAQEADSNGQDHIQKRFDNGVSVDIEQSNGWPVRLTLEDKDAQLKETVTLDQESHRITEDKVEHCGVSRLRKFSMQGEAFRAYSFEGGKIEKSGLSPTFIPE